MAQDDVVLKISATTTGLDSALSTAKSSVSSFASESTNALGSLSGAFNGVTGAIQGISTALGAGAIGGAIAGIVSSIESMSARAAEMRTMSDTIGVTVGEFQAMSATADEAGVSVNVFARATEKLTILLDNARDGSGAAIAKLRDMGVSLQQINNPAFTLNDLLGALRERLNDTSTAQNEHNVLLKEFGGRLAEAIPLIKAYDGSLAGVAAKDAQINALAPEQVKRLTEISGWWKTLGVEIANATSKYLIFLASTPTGGVGKAGLLGSPTQAGDLAGNAQGDGQQQAAAAAAAAAAQTQEVVVTGSRVSTEAVLKDLKEQVSATQAGTSERVAAVRAYYAASLEDLGKDADTTKAAHAELITAEREFQTAKLAEIIRGNNQVTAAYKAASAAGMQLVAADLAATKSALDESVSAAESAAKQTEDAQVGSINRAIEAVHAQGALHQISAATELQETRALLDQEYAAEVAYYAKIRALEVAAGTSTKGTDDAQEAAHQSYLSKLQKADQTFAAQNAAEWKALGQSMTSSFASNLTQVIEGTQSATQAIRSLFASVIDQLIQMFVRLGVEWVINQFVQREATAATANAQIAAYAGVAGAAGIASFAGAPWPIDLGAPAFGAEMFGDAAAYSVATAGAAGGFDVPRMVNPVTQLHGGEMVLPQNLADAVRAGAGSGGGRGGDTHHYHFGPSLDAKSFDDWMHTPSARATLVNAISHAYNRGRRPK